MRETQERQIRGVTYKSTPVAARKAAGIGLRLAKIFGPGIASMAAMEDTDENLGMLAGEAAQRIANMIDEEVGIQLIMDILLDTIRIDPETHTKQLLREGLIFDEVFRGNLGEMMLALGFALEVNGFFGPAGIGTLLERVEAMASRMGWQGSRDASTKAS